jgi:hypothetical protein
MDKKADTYDATMVRSILMEMPDVVHKEVQDDGVANLVLQLCFQAVRYLDSEVMRSREVESIDSMFEGLITTDEEPSYKEETTWQESTLLPNETSSES